MIHRQEKSKEFHLIHSLIKAAFDSAEHADGNEQDLVDALRKGDSYVPELSLVAEIDGKIVGHIMFTKLRIGNSTQLALAPLSVLPEYQKQGIGTALIHEGHKRARTLGYWYSVVLGNEKYYYFNESLPTNSERIGKINTGDLMLYGSDCLVLFYKSFSTSYSYTRLGHIDNPQGLADVVGSGNITVTFEVAN